jgi:gluconokinase
LVGFAVLATAYFSMSIVPGLRSPYAKIGGVVYFARMLDKIRLHARGVLPVAEYAANLGKAFDARCCAFLRVNYDELKARTLAGDLGDDQLFAWCRDRGGQRSEEEIEVWNGFMMKRGWRDAGAEMLAKRIAENKFEGKPIMTMFDYIDFDEGRDPVAGKAWEK